MTQISSLLGTSFIYNGGTLRRQANAGARSAPCIASAKPLQRSIADTRSTAATINIRIPLYTGLKQNLFFE
jgi:hypothetical protein